MIGSMFPLKLATASQNIILGPFLDSTDFNTEKTGLTIANTDIKLWKSGAANAVNKHSGGATHDANGSYVTTLDDTDTNTLGPLRVTVHVATALPAQLWCCVVPVEVYDGLIDPGTAAIQMMNLHKLGIKPFTVQASPAPTANSFATNLTGSSYPDGSFDDQAIFWITGSNVGLAPIICSTSLSANGLTTGKQNFLKTVNVGDTGYFVGVVG